MTSRLAVSLLGPAVALSLAGPALADCRSFTKAPKTLGNMDLLLHKKLDTRQEGVVIKFGGRGQILSVFKFEGTTDAISDDAMRDELKGSAGAIRYATEQRGDEVVATRELPAWAVGRRQFQAEAITATYKSYDVTAFEYVGLSHDAECYFKVRFTNASDADDASSFDRYKSYVTQAHELLLKPEEYEEPREEDVPDDEAAAETSEEAE